MSKKWSALIAFMVLVVIIGTVSWLYSGGYLKSGDDNSTASPESPSGTASKLTIVGDQETGKDDISFLLPSGWISKPYYPEGTGVAIVLFEGENKLENSAAGYGGFLEYSVRSISGTFLSNYNADLTRLDKTFQKVDGYAGIAIDSESFSGGKYTCSELSNSTKRSLQCYVSYEDQKLNASIQLNTFSQNYSEDVLRLKEVISSLKKL